MRGEHSAGVVECAVGAGIIPACAGNTSSPSGGIGAMRDHPRMRGEHRHSQHLLQASRGSSPHARGTPEVTAGNSRTNGIIPACAGNTMPHNEHRANLRDHPRMRGEHMAAATDVSNPWGSSPHARGTHMGRGTRHHMDGIIPACAGNTHAPATEISISRDHPRMRGEHTKKIA